MSWFGLIWALLSLFQLMHHWQKSYLDWTLFWRSIPLPPLPAGCSSPSTQGGLFFSWLVFWASTQFEFTYIKWNNRQMGFANMRNENIVKSSNHRLNCKIENLHTDVAYWCIIATTTKWDHVSLFLESKKKFLIRLHSSTFVCDSSTLVYTRLHLSSDTSVFL